MKMENIKVFGGAAVGLFGLWIFVVLIFSMGA
jgi:hypothetical protein